VGARRARAQGRSLRGRGHRHRRSLLQLPRIPAQAHPGAPRDLTIDERGADRDRLPSDESLRERGLLALEGGFLVERAVAAGLEIVEAACVPSRAAWTRALGLDPIILSEAEIANSAGYPFHRGVRAVARRPVEPSPEEIVPSGTEPSLILALPEIADPENLGSCFRSAAALGAAALLLGPRSPDPLSRRALRVSMGSTLSLPWARLPSPAGLALLEERGFLAAACVLDPSARDIRGWEAPSRVALVLGNEAFGLSAPWLGACGAGLTLEMRGGTDSLNVSTAAAIFLYELSRRPSLDPASGR
jgi:tRNA G18 (ribose-2'-O)-methylase SpoU